MKRLLAAALFILGAQAAVAAPACWPAPVGNGTGFSAGSVPITINVVDPATGAVTGTGTGSGSYIFYHCADAYTVQRVEMCWRSDHLLAFPDASQLKDLSVKGLFDAFWTANVKKPCTDATFKPIYDKMKAHPGYAGPAAPVYKVAPNGTALDRPAFALQKPNGGARAKTATGAYAPAVGRAPVGATCSCADPKLRALEGTTLYCPFTANPTVDSLVAVCRKPS